MPRADRKPDLSPGQAAVRQAGLAAPAGSSAVAKSLPGLRVQLPRDMLDQLGMRDRVRLEAEPDHIGVWPDEGRP